ncbi:MAG: hypothetical protein ABEI98_01415 [Halorhabdus sp.]
MNLRDRQFYFGTGLGVVAFAAARVASWFAIPNGLLPPGHSRVVVWMALSAAGLDITAVAVTGPFQLGGADLSAAVERFRYLRAVPPAAVAVAAILANDVVGYTTRARHILENSLWVLPGYWVAVAAAALWSGARPGLTVFVFVAGIGAAALFVGSRIVGGLVGGIPVLAFASLGTVALIGLVAVLGAAAIVGAFWAVVWQSMGAALIGGGAVWAVRNAAARSQ